MTKKILLTLLFASFVLSACGGNTTPDPALDPNLAMTAAFATVNAAFHPDCPGNSHHASRAHRFPNPTTAPQPTNITPSVTLPVVVKSQPIAALVRARPMQNRGSCEPGKCSKPSDAMQSNAMAARPGSRDGRNPPG